MNKFKFIAITLLLFAAQLTALAQETPFGKKLAEDFWAALEKKSYVAAKSKLDSLKRREPNFDASKMEKALSDATTQRDDALAASRSALRAKVSGGTSLKELFFTRVIQADSFDTRESITAEIEKYADKTDEVLAVDRASLASDLENALESLKKDLSTDAEKNAKLVKQVGTALEPKHAEAAYYELLLRQSYWDNARKIFPAEAEISKAYEKITGSIGGLGSPEQRAAIAKKNYGAKVDAERLPKAAVNDASIEKILQTAFTRNAEARDLKLTFLKAVAVTSDYSLDRHSITGILLGRSRGGAIAFKDQNGKCQWIYYQVYQDYVGSSFSGAWRGVIDSRGSEMRCENVK